MASEAVYKILVEMNGMEGAMRGLDDLSHRLGVTTAGLVALDTVAAQAFVKYEYALARVATVSDDVRLRSEAFKTGILDLTTAVDHSTNKVEAANAAYEIASSGFEKQADILNILERSTKTAVAGFSDVQTVSEAAMKTYNSYAASAKTLGSVQEGMNRITNEAIVVQNLGVITVGQYATQIGRVSAAAASAGISLEEVNAYIAAATRNGVPARQAFTALQATIASIVTPSQQAVQESARIGLAFDAETLKTRGLSYILNELATNTQKTAKTQGLLFNSVEAFKGVSAAAGDNIGQFNKFLKQMEIAASGAGDEVDKAYAIMAETKQLKIIQAMNSVTDALTELGGGVAIIIEPVAKAITFLSENFEKLPEPIKQGAGAFLLLAGGAATLGLALVVTVGYIVGVTNSLRKVWEWLNGAKVSFKDLFDLLFNRNKEFLQTATLMNDMSNSTTSTLAIEEKQVRLLKAAYDGLNQSKSNTPAPGPTSGSDGPVGYDSPIGPEPGPGPQKLLAGSEDFWGSTPMGAPTAPTAGPQKLLPGGSEATPLLLPPGVASAIETWPNLKLEFEEIAQAIQQEALPAVRKLPEVVTLLNEESDLETRQHVVYQEIDYSTFAPLGLSDEQIESLVTGEATNEVKKIDRTNTGRDIARNAVESGATPGTVLLKAQVGDIDKAFMSYTNGISETYVNFLGAIEPGGGAGEALLKEAMKAAKENGTKLLLSPLSDAISFYRAMGMQMDDLGHMVLEFEDLERRIAAPMIKPDKALAEKLAGELESTFIAINGSLEAIPAHVQDALNLYNQFSAEIENGNLLAQGYIAEAQRDLNESLTSYKDNWSYIAAQEVGLLQGVPGMEAKREHKEKIALAEDAFTYHPPNTEVKQLIGDRIGDLRLKEIQDVYKQIQALEDISPDAAAALLKLDEAISAVRWNTANSEPDNRALTALQNGSASWTNQLPAPQALTNLFNGVESSLEALATRLTGDFVLLEGGIETARAELIDLANTGVYTVAALEGAPDKILALIDGMVSTAYIEERDIDLSNVPALPDQVVDKYGRNVTRGAQENAIFEAGTRLQPLLAQVGDVVNKVEASVRSLSDAFTPLEATVKSFYDQVYAEPQTAGALPPRVAGGSPDPWGDTDRPQGPFYNAPVEPDPWAQHLPTSGPDSQGQTKLPAAPGQRALPAGADTTQAQIDALSKSWENLNKKSKGTYREMIEDFQRLNAATTETVGRAQDSSLALNNLNDNVKKTQQSMRDAVDQGYMPSSQALKDLADATFGTSTAQGKARVQGVSLKSAWSELSQVGAQLGAQASGATGKLTLMGPAVAATVAQLATMAATTAALTAGLWGMSKAMENWNNLQAENAADSNLESLRESQSLYSAVSREIERLAAGGAMSAEQLKALNAALSGTTNKTDTLISGIGIAFDKVLPKGTMLYQVIDGLLRLQGSNISEELGKMGKGTTALATESNGLLKLQKQLNSTYGQTGDAHDVIATRAKLSFDQLKFLYGQASLAATRDYQTAKSRGDLLEAQKLPERELLKFRLEAANQYSQVITEQKNKELELSLLSVEDRAAATKAIQEAQTAQAKAFDAYVTYLNRRALDQVQAYESKVRAVIDRTQAEFNASQARAKAAGTSNELDEAKATAAATIEANDAKAASILREDKAKQDTYLKERARQQAGSDELKKFDEARKAEVAKTEAELFGLAQASSDALIAQKATEKSTLEGIVNASLEAGLISEYEAALKLRDLEALFAEESFASRQASLQAEVNLRGAVKAQEVAAIESQVLDEDEKGRRLLEVKRRYTTATLAAQQELLAAERTQLSANLGASLAAYNEFYTKLEGLAETAKAFNQNALDSGSADQDLVSALESRIDKAKGNNFALKKIQDEFAAIGIRINVFNTNEESVKARTLLLEQARLKIEERKLAIQSQQAEIETRLANLKSQSVIAESQAKLDSGALTPAQARAERLKMQLEAAKMQAQTEAGAVARQSLQNSATLLNVDKAIAGVPQGGFDGRLEDVKTPSFNRYSNAALEEIKNAQLSTVTNGIELSALARERNDILRRIDANTRPVQAPRQTGRS